MAPETPSPLPRILCLHGGGTSSTIFRLQCRSLIRRLRHSFHLVFAEAPHLYPSPGPDVLSVYKAYGPFKSWLPPYAMDDVIAAGKIEGSIRKAVLEDDGEGEWVGLLGFSQGAKVAASVLYETQLRGGYAGVEWRFAILLAGRGPLVALGDLENAMGKEELDMPGDGMGVAPPTRKMYSHNERELRLERPTVHVHGLKDPGVELHRVLWEDYTLPGTGELVEWGGEHRVPITSRDVERVVKAVFRAAERAGVPRTW